MSFIWENCHHYGETFLSPLMSYWYCHLSENSRKSDVNHLTSCMMSPQLFSAKTYLAFSNDSIAQQLFLRHAKKYYFRTSLDSKEHNFAAIITDLSNLKHFQYSINHKLLNLRQVAYSATQNALHLLHSQLTKRKQHVQVNGGVPQDSFFSLCIFE